MRATMRTELKKIVLLEHEGLQISLTLDEARRLLGSLRTLEREPEQAIREREVVREMTYERWCELAPLSRWESGASRLLVFNALVNAGVIKERK